MTKQPKITSPLPDAIIDLLMEDILATSDEEIMEEVRKEYQNEAEETKKLQELVLAAIQKSNKQKLYNAKKKFDAMPNNNMNNVHQLSLEDKKKLIARATQSIDDLTLAARNATDMTEQDTDSMLEDLIDLGVIDENGNLK